MENISFSSRSLPPADLSFFGQNPEFAPSAPPAECETMWCSIKGALPYVLPLLLALLTYLYIDAYNKEENVEPMDPAMQWGVSLGAAALTFGLVYAFKRYT